MQTCLQNEAVTRLRSWQWARIPAQNHDRSSLFGGYVQYLKIQNLMDDDGVAPLFFRIATEMAVEAWLVKVRREWEAPPTCLIYDALRLLRRMRARAHGKVWTP